MDLNKLCNELNNKIGVDIFEVKENNTIRFKDSVNYKFVKKHFLDDLITFFEGKPRMTLRLQDYAIELSNGMIVVTKDLLFY